jgi:general secretion pathway protein G
MVRMEFRAGSTALIETKTAAQGFQLQRTNMTNTKEITMNRKLRRLRRAQSILTKRCYRTLERGVTLIEILIVLAIVGMIAGGVAVYAVPKFKESQIKSAKISAQDLQSIADGWRADNGNDCPTPQRLKTEKQMSAGSSLNDPWGAPWKIACDGESTTVISSGPDKKEGTPDDIHFPPDEQPTN